MKQLPSCLTNNQLKILAILSMVADHICLVFFPDSPIGSLIRLTVGRLAMPLFAFLLYEGFFHTKNRSRYGRNLLLFALISEPVFDLAHTGSWFSLQGQNTLFTLLASLLMLCLLESSAYNNTILQVPIVALFAIGAWLLKLDHDVSMIAMVTIFYFFRWHGKFLQIILACGAAAAISGNPGIFLAAIPLLLYNEKRGRSSLLLKYTFYAIYPAHFLILCLLRQFLFHTF